MSVTPVSMFMSVSGLLVESGGSYKVTSLEETSERIDNAFDKAISDHDKKMKALAESKSKEDECKCFTPSPQTNTKHSCVHPLHNLLITQPDNQTSNLIMLFSVNTSSREYDILSKINLIFYFVMYYNKKIYCEG